MSQIKILIADPNEVYLDGIALEFLKREPDRVDLHGITENDYWEEFCGASEEYDIALINERMAGEEIPADRFRHIFILTETMDGTDLSVFSKKDINGTYLLPLPVIFCVRIFYRSPCEPR